MHYVGTRNPRAEHSPVRSVPLYRLASAVFGYTPEQRAEFAKSRDLANARHALASANAALADARRSYVQARADIGAANRSISRGLAYPRATAAQRRGFRSIAFRMFNIRLRELRAAEKRRAEAEAAFLALVEA